MTKSAIFRWLVISFIAGTGVESFITIPIIGVWLAGMSGITIAVLAWRRHHLSLGVIALALLGLLAGIVRMQYVRIHAPDLSAFSERRVVMTGRIKDDPVGSAQSQRFILSVNEISGTSFVSPIRVTVITRKYPPYEQGDVLRVQGIVEAAPYDGITAGTVFSVKEEKTGEHPQSFVLRWIRQAKTAFNTNVTNVLPEPHASFMKGLLLGEKASIPADLRERFRQAGVSHIVALSGYNITIVGAFLVDILLMLTVSFWLTFWIAGGSILFFVLLTGASASLVRAAIMGILVLVAAREGRMYHMTNALVLAGAVMLAFNPYLLRFDVGFELSFLATLGLIYLTAPVERVFTTIEYRIRQLSGAKQLPKDEHRVIRGIKNAMSTTLAAQLAVLPLILYLFGGVSVVAPVSNLFVLALVPATMAFGFLTGAAGFVAAPLSAVFGWCAWILLAYELAMINFFARIPFAFASVSGIGTIFVIVCYAFFLWNFFIKRLWIRSHH